jgi:hypothetical protein
MSSSPKIPFKKATVFWLDAFTDAGWEDSKAVKGEAGCVCITSGFIVNEDKNGITIASTVGPTNSPLYPSGWQTNSRIFIPRGFIKKIA